MEELSFCPISNGKYYSNENDNEIFDEEENEQPLDDTEQQQQQQQPIQNARGGRRKGVPRRLQLSPEVVKLPTQRLLPLSLTKAASTTVHHHEQPILTSDQEDENDTEDIYRQNQIEQNYLQLNLLSTHVVDNNNNHEEVEDILEIVDDILADIVTTIVKDVKEQRKKVVIKTNGHSKQRPALNGISKIPNGKPFTNGLSKSQSQSSACSSKVPDRSKSSNDSTKATSLNSQQQLAKHKLSPPSSFSSPTASKRQRTSETPSQPSTPLAIQQQLLWEMTQQLMMSSAVNETDSLAGINSSLLKQQLLGLTQTDAIPKRTNRPSKPEVHSTGMSSSANVIPPVSHPSTSPLHFDRGNFAPRRRGRPPKYVTDRGLAGLPSLDLDPSSLASPYDQLFAAIENGMGTSPSGASAAAFQSALASMLGQQAGLQMPTSAVPRNAAPASMVKSSAGQSRHSLPAPSMSNATKLPLDLGNGALDMPLMATKKRGPGRPPKSQMLFDPHQILQATQRLNSPTHNSFPPTMVPSSPSSFDLNAAFVEMLQQQQH